MCVCVNVVYAMSAVAANDMLKPHIRQITLGRTFSKSVTRSFLSNRHRLLCRQTCLVFFYFGPFGSLSVFYIFIEYARSSIKHTNTKNTSKTKHK